MAPFVLSLSYYYSFLVKPQRQKEERGRSGWGRAESESAVRLLATESFCFLLCLTSSCPSPLPSQCELVYSQLLFILFLCLLHSRLWKPKMQMSRTLGLRNGDGADRWILHAPLWSAAVKCCFVFEGWHRASQKRTLDLRNFKEVSVEETWTFKQIRHLAAYVWYLIIQSLKNGDRCKNILLLL